MNVCLCMCWLVFLWVCVCMDSCENKFRCFQSSIYSVSSVLISQFRNTEASRRKMMIKKNIESGLYRCFWQLFIQHFLFHTWERTSKLNIINPKDNGRKTPPLRCYIESSPLSTAWYETPYFTKVHQKLK